VKGAKQRRRKGDPPTEYNQSSVDQLWSPDGAIQTVKKERDHFIVKKKSQERRGSGPQLHLKGRPFRQKGEIRQAQKEANRIRIIETAFR